MLLVIPLPVSSRSCYLLPDLYWDAPGRRRAAHRVGGVGAVGGAAPRGRSHGHGQDHGTGRPRLGWVLTRCLDRALWVYCCSAACAAKIQFTALMHQDGWLEMGGAGLQSCEQSF